MGIQRQRQSHLWDRVPRVQTKRSTFDRSHGYKTTFDEGYLIPFYTDEVVPGDTHKMSANFLCRLSTVTKPIMDNLYLETFYFFVPFRLLWDNWQRMWGEQDKPTDSTDYLVPQVSAPPATPVASLTLWDYFGLPVGVPNLSMSALYPRAYNKIWNDWFRDQNLQDSVPEVTGDTDDPTNYTLLKRGKRHDYFTSCLPWPQKGPEVLLPIGGVVPVVGAKTGDPGFVNGQPVFGREDGSGTPGVLYDATGGAVMHASPATEYKNLVWADPQLVADLGEASAVTINDFREAVVIQQFYEALARGGSRYTELLQNIYGVTNGDARLQRPEYLGGGRTSIYVNPVVNTAGSADVPQANLAGYGVASTRRSDNHGFTKSFTEHGVIIGLLSVRADLSYQQGMLRQFSRKSKFDFLIPHFANLGEQPVYNKEIYAQGSLVLNPQGEPVDDDVFGYVARYDDYRFKPSLITGLFRSTVSADKESVDFWHLAQDFASLPALSPEFIQEQPPVARVLAVPEEPHFLLDSWLSLQSTRELPTYSVPGIRRV